MFKNQNNDLKNLVKGKKKVGGIKIGLNMKLLKIIFENNKEFILRS